MKKLGMTLTMLACVLNAHAQLEIVSFNGNGELAWQDNFTNGTYTVQWCFSLSETNWLSSWTSLRQIAATGGVITVRVPMFFRVAYHPRETNDLVLIAGGGQPYGPLHDFYMSRFEVRNEDFAQFLNDAEAHSGDARGANMHFAYNGMVYFDSAESSSEVLFDITDSRLLYNSANAVGTRYSVYPEFIGHPIVGVSWYGCVKYCNWLTLHTGRGESERCYAEGTTGADWRPVHLSSAQWTDGFDDAERLQWIQNYAGFRLPMDDTEGGASYYNEWYKAAAWNGSENTTWGFGRNNLTGPDANYDNSGDPFEAYTPATTPVGYYDGSLQGGTYQTASNANWYGIYDLTGNADEWVNDNSPGSVPHCRGGGWDGGVLQNNNLHGNLQRYGTDNVTGFRVVTTEP